MNLGFYWGVFGDAFAVWVFSGDGRRCEVMSSERPAFYCCMLSYPVMEYRYLRGSADELLNFGYEREMREILLENFTGGMAPQSCLGSASS